MLATSLLLSLSPADRLWMDTAGGSRAILVVEDEESIRTFFAKALRLAGYTALEAATAEEGLRAMNEGVPPDGVLLDLSMPGMGGLGFLRRLREYPEHRRVPVAIVTGHVVIAHDVRLAADELGVQVYHKPVDMEGLLQLTRVLLSGRRITSAGSEG
jgi:CheY-like chemotaxis protein